MVTDPDLQVISGGLGEGLAEPRRVVKHAAGARGTTPHAIPQWVTGERNDMPAGITEIIASNKPC